MAARPTEGSVNVVNESARKITGVPVRRGRLRCQRISVSRSKRGRGRRRVMPSRPTGAGRFESGADALPSRLSVRIAPNTPRAQRRPVQLVVVRERLGLQRRHVDRQRALALARLALEAEVEDLVQALVAERLVRVGLELSALTSAFARPRVACSSSRVAM